jgi:cytochrome c2
MRSTRRPLLYQLAWLILVILVLLCLPVIHWRVPWWELPRGEVRAIIVLLVAYGVTALGVMLFARPGLPRAFSRGLALALSVFGLFLLGLLLNRVAAPRYLLLPMFVAVLALAPFAVAPRTWQIAGIGMLSLVLLAVAALDARVVFAQHKAQVKIATTDVKTAFYALRVRSHEGLVAVPATRGGGIDHLGDRILLGTGDGHLYTLRVAGDDLQAHALAVRVPANREEFAAAFNGSAVAPQIASNFVESSPEVQTWRFRVADVIAQVDGDAVHVFASHHFWKQQEQCFVVRVSQWDTTLADIDRAAGPGTWHTIFESRPCVPLYGAGSMRGKNPFRGEEIGGRLALLDANTLLLTLGDHGFSGIEGDRAYAQDTETSYGKTWRIDLRTRSASLNTLGHRNPQGLYVAPDGRIWETEHAAQGGDELNLLTSGANYGWPEVTYGTDYGALIWPLSKQQGRHAGYTQPVYSWLPGIGISNLVQIQHERFATWRGDLLIGTLGVRGLFRVVLDGDRAIVTEPIPLQKRVRDVLELADGRLLLWTDEAALLTIEPASGSGAALQFSTVCSGCHRISDGFSHRMGPDLYKLLDRNVASADNYGAYTPALKKLGGTWDRERLDRFLRDPQAVAPGTSMVFPGIADDRQRAAMVDYVIATSKVGGQ